MEPNNIAGPVLTLTSEDTIPAASSTESAATFSRAATSACETTEILELILLHLPYGDLKPHLSRVRKSLRKTILGNNNQLKRLNLVSDTSFAATDRQTLPFRLSGITRRFSVHEKTITFTIGRCTAAKRLRHATMRTLLVCQPPLNTRLVAGMAGFHRDACPKRVKIKCKMERGGDRWEGVRVGYVIDYVEALWNVGCTCPSVTVHLNM